MKKCLRQKCGKEFEPKKPKQMFCCDACRVYSKRESQPPKKRGRPKKEVQLPPQPPQNESKGKIDELIREERGLETKSIPPMPIRMKGEDSFDYAARKNEWKLKYNQ